MIGVVKAAAFKVAVVGSVVFDGDYSRYDAWSERDTVNNILFCLQKVMDFMKKPFTFGNITVKLWECVVFSCVGGAVFWAASRLMDIDD
jgi:monoamine oxidase